MGYQVKVLVGALAEVYRLEQSTLSRGEIEVDLVKLVSYNEEPGGHLEALLVLPYLVSAQRKRMMMEVMKMTTTMMTMTKLISRIRVTSKEEDNQCKGGNNPGSQ